MQKQRQNDWYFHQKLKNIIQQRLDPILRISSFITFKMTKNLFFLVWNKNQEIQALIKRWEAILNIELDTFKKRGLDNLISNMLI